MNRVLPVALFLLVVSALAVFAESPPVYSGGIGCTIEVNSTGDDITDDSVVTLREAMSFAFGSESPGLGEEGQIECSIGDPGPFVTDTIVFDETEFPAGDPETIALGSGLPALVGDTVDGTGAGVVIDGSAGEFSCFFVPGSFSVIRGLHIEGCVTGVEITGVFIVVPVGAQPQGVPAANENLIANNVIEGNGTGILLDNDFTARNMISGNLIGTGGDAGLAGNTTGILIDGAVDTYVGPEPVVVPVGGVPGPNEGNVISGNEEAGVYLSEADGTIVQGNFIGTDASGMVAAPNGFGVEVFGSAFVVIGGENEGEGNLISGNDAWGIRLFGSDTNDTRVAGNYIGTDVTGNAALGNGTMGVLLVSAQGNQIGGAEAGEGNVISGNEWDGVAFTGVASMNDVQGNLIGVGADGETPAGNLMTGVTTYGGIGSNIVGGEEAAQNVIAHNGTDGVSVTSEVLLGDTAPQGGPPPMLEIQGNSVHSNGGLGIDLGDDGIDFNDNLDPDVRENLGQNYPILTMAETNGNTHIEGTLNSTISTGFVLRFYANDECDPTDYGEGQTYLGSKVVNTGADGNVSWAADVDPAEFGQLITATAADAAGNTSEFSECIAVEGGATPTPSPSPTPSPTPTPSPSPTPAPAILGDTDCDLDADAVDALHVLQEVAGLEPNVGCIDQGDTQCDGDIDAVDALGILTFVAGLPPQPQDPGCPAVGDPIV